MNTQLRTLGIPLYFAVAATVGQATAPTASAQAARPEVDKAEVTKVVQRHFEGAQIRNIKAESEPYIRYHEVELHHRGHEVEVNILPNGMILYEKHEASHRELPDSVRERHSDLDRRRVERIVVHTVMRPVELERPITLWSVKAGEGDNARRMLVDTEGREFHAVTARDGHRGDEQGETAKRRGDDERHAPPAHARHGKDDDRDERRAERRGDDERKGPPAHARHGKDDDQDERRAERRGDDERKGPPAHARHGKDDDRDERRAERRGDDERKGPPAHARHGKDDDRDERRAERRGDDERHARFDRGDTDAGEQPKPVADAPVLRCLHGLPGGVRATLAHLFPEGRVIESGRDREEDYWWFEVRHQGRLHDVEIRSNGRVLKSRITRD